MKTFAYLVRWYENEECKAIFFPSTYSIDEVRQNILTQIDKDIIKPDDVVEIFWVSHRTTHKIYQQAKFDCGFVEDF